MTAPGILVTAFPVPGNNFRCLDGKVRGVTQVDTHEGVITVTYIDGHDEQYAPEHVQEVTTK
jgi:hypothetical protein